MLDNQRHWVTTLTPESVLDLHAAIYTIAMPITNYQRVYWVYSPSLVAEIPPKKKKKIVRSKNGMAFHHHQIPMENTPSNPHGNSWNSMGIHHEKRGILPMFALIISGTAPSFSVPPVCPCPGDSDSPPGEP